MGVVSEVAQSVAESLLGKNAAGFTNSMKRNQDAAIEKEKSRIQKEASKEGEEKLRPGTGVPLRGMRKGGKVRATGKRMLHKGEMVARKTPRTKCRGGRS